jgi:hypothetical protein
MDSQNRIRTSDLYFGAYLLASGSKLDKVNVMIDAIANKKKVHFEFVSPRIKPLADEYISGDAKVNLRELRASIKHLKDIVFERIGERKEPIIQH